MDRREFIKKGMLGLSAFTLSGLAGTLGGCSSANANERGFYITDKCVGCKKCLSACFNNAIENSSNGLMINQDKCIKCGACFKACPNHAIEER